MADAIFSSLLTNLNSVAVQEFGIAWGLETELNNLKSTLSTIQAVLVDAEAKQWTSEAVENWLRKLKDAAYDADDVVDEFAIEAQKRKLDSQRGVTHRVSSFFSIPNRLIFRVKMGHKIKDVKERLDRIAGERSFHLREGLMEPDFLAVVGRQTSSIVNESEIIGRSDEKEMIVKILLDDSSDCPGVPVYAICGMGGLGKTTLASLVYNDKEVQGLFNLRIWVTVSDDFDIKRLTRAILESIKEDTRNIDNLDPLQRRLQEKLSGKRFLLVLDDVWNEYHGKWNKLQDVLRCGGKGSKVIVTTRSQKVAHIMATTTLPVHHMDRLSEDDAWSLFKQRAFDSGRREENHVLDQIGKTIVKKCGGLPLAIKALGSLMQLKSSESEWLCVKNSDIWDLPDDGSTILPALRLSYDNLPPHLRQCFAYCCIFPKDTEMGKDMLIELWMANGFIPSKGEASLHDTGHEIFNHLVWRSFLQDVEENFEGEIVCKMHDLMHDLALSIMQHHLYVANSDKDLKIPEKARHLCLNTNLTEKVLWNEVMLEVKSLRSLVFGGYSEFCRDEVARLVLKQKYLRVLHLWDYLPIEKVLRSISNCKHLRYLNLSNSGIKSLPESVCDLQKLETLKLRDCDALCKLPKRMKHMKNLVYLAIKGCDSLISMPPKLGQLTSLRRLDKFIVGRDEGYRIGELKDLNLWGELSIEKLDNVRTSEDADHANLKKKQDLVSLTLQWSASKEEILPNNVEEVLESLQPHKNLKNLTINNYRGLKFPNWMLGSVLKNLVKLSLHSCSRCEQLPPLGKLHSLKNLEIAGMDSLKYFDPECYGDGEISFPALENLTLRHMPSLEEWTTMDRQYIFPCLRTFEIIHCPKLTKLPFLPTLQSLTIERLTIGAVSNLTRLTSLWITNFQLEILPDGLFQNMKALKFLAIFHCRTLKNLSGLENLNSLESLHIFVCPSLTDLAVLGLEGLTSLRCLIIECCRKLRSLPEGMEHLTVLQRLLISGCPELQSFPEGMQHLDALQSLRSMPDWLRGLKNLRELRIRECPHLESRCKKESGEDWPKIAHIPNIWINEEEVQSLDD